MTKTNIVDQATADYYASVALQWHTAPTSPLARFVSQGVPDDITPILAELDALLDSWMDLDFPATPNDYRDLASLRAYIVLEHGRRVPDDVDEEEIRQHRIEDGRCVVCGHRLSLDEIVFQRRVCETCRDMDDLPFRTDFTVTLS